MNPSKKKLNQWKSVGLYAESPAFLIQHKSPGLPYRSPNFLGKIEFWAFQCFSLDFSSSKIQIFFFNQRMLSVAFLNIVFSSLAAKTILLIFTVCNLCETSDNVLSQTHVIIWGHWVDLRLWGQRCLMLVVLQNRQSPDFKSPEVGTSEGDGFSQMKWPRLQLIVVHCTEITFSI